MDLYSLLSGCVDSAGGGDRYSELLWLTLNRQDIPVARCTAERLMRPEGRRGVVRGTTKRTTIADPAAELPRDLVCRRFALVAPDRLWMAELT